MGLDVMAKAILWLIIICFGQVDCTSPHCPHTIQECTNCEYDQDNSCMTEFDLSKVEQSHSKRIEACLEKLINTATVFAVVYKPDEEKCFFYDCDKGVSYHAGYKAFVKTCTTGCLNATLNYFPATQVVDQFHVTEGIDSLEDCTEMLTRKGISGTVTYAGISKTCSNTSTCSTNCATVTDDNFETVVMNCHGTVYSVPPPSKSTSGTPAKTTMVHTTPQITQTTTGLSPTQTLSFSSTSTERQKCIEMCNCTSTNARTNRSESDITSLIIRQTTINPKNTTLARSRLYSRADDRVSSTFIGILAAVVICGIVGFIVFLDVSSCVQTIRKEWRKVNKVKPTQVKC